MHCKTCGEKATHDNLCGLCADDVFNGGVKSGAPEAENLTSEQVENWRTILLGMLGPYANLMTPEEIQLIRDKVQSAANDTK